MILKGATSFRGALEGVGPENRDFFGPKKVGNNNTGDNLTPVTMTTVLIYR
jgi:hypothetical protein